MRQASQRGSEGFIVVAPSSVSCALTRPSLLSTWHQYCLIAFSTSLLVTNRDNRGRVLRVQCRQAWCSGILYFEWTGPKNDRQPHYFTRADGQPIGLAGLWDRWKSKDKSETKETFTIVTTEPSKFAAQFHNRMPLILEPDTWDLWMTGEPDAAIALMKPANEDALVSRPVSKAVGDVKNNGPELLA